MIGEDPYESQERRYHDHDIDATALHHPIVKDDQILMNWEVGGGLWTYYIGIGKYLQDHYELDNVVFVGHSAGAEVIYWLTLGMPIQEVWEGYRDFIEGVDKCLTKVFFNWNRHSRKGHMDFIDEVYRGERKNPTDEAGAILDPKVMLEKLKARHFVGGSKLVFKYGFIPYMEKVYYGNYRSHSGVIKCILGSYTIPFLTAPLRWPFQTIEAEITPRTRLSGDGQKGEESRMERHKVVDSWWSNLGPHRYEHPSERTININPRLWRNFGLAYTWIWTSVEYNQRMYELGYEDAKAFPEVFSLLTPKKTVGSLTTNTTLSSKQ